MLDLFRTESNEIPIQPETLEVINNFPITNSMTTGAVMTIFLLVIGLIVFFTFKKDKPSRFQLFIEMIVETFVNFLTPIAGGRKVALRILPIIGTVFIYIGLSNVILIFPAFSGFTYNGTSMFRSHTFDFNTTFSIAALLVILTQFYSIKDYNPIGHFLKYIKIDYVFKSFRKGILPGFISIIEFAVGFLDIVSEFAKIISLSLRLFGNLFAGEILIALLSSVFAIGLPVPLILVFGLFSGLIQALVFGSLSASHFGIALKQEE